MSKKWNELKELKQMKAAAALDLKFLLRQRAMCNFRLFIYSIFFHWRRWRRPRRRRRRWKLRRDGASNCRLRRSVFASWFHSNQVKSIDSIIFNSITFGFWFDSNQVNWIWLMIWIEFSQIIWLNIFNSIEFGFRFEFDQVKWFEFNSIRWIHSLQWPI